MHKQILQQGESERVEFKSSFQSEVIETLVAFANTRGGTVYVGVDDEGQVIGVELGKETLQKWMNEIKIKTQPAIIPTIQVHKFDSVQFVSIEVQEFPVKPLSFKGRYYKRLANSNHQLSALEITEMNLKSLQLSWDSYSKPEKKLDDLDELKIQKFIQQVNLSSRFQLSGNWKNDLKKLKLVTDYSITNASWLLFGKDEIEYNIHLGRFKSPSLIVDDKMLRLPLFEAVDETIKYIISQIKFAFEISGETSKRTEIPEYPLEAIRELVLNAIIHRDYLSPTDIQIKIFDNQITFFSPGKLHPELTIQDLDTDSYPAYARNKLISEAFYLTGDVEKYGSGFQRIRESISYYPTMELILNEISGGFMVTLKYVNQKIVSAIENQVTEQVIEQVTEQVTEQVLRLILAIENEMTRGEIMQVLHLNHRPTFLYDYLKPALELQVIEMTIPNKPTSSKQKYRLTEYGKLFRM